ncbi:hypothetical protein ACSAGD_10365 [Paramicrobacterium sp. CJ85]|uniref:hypothetical protein n=1 Tax=Paramicrobacterium sp. CJ85 TaxID=3445355 RepID=UPI003F5F2F62
MPLSERAVAQELPVHDQKSYDILNSLYRFSSGFQRRKARSSKEKTLLVAHHPLASFVDDAENIAA